MNNSLSRQLRAFFILFPFLLIFLCHPLGIGSIQAQGISETRRFDSETSAKLIEIGELIKSEDYNLARQELEGLIEKYDDVPKLHLVKANIITEQQGEQEALDYLTKQIDAQPDNIGLYAARAQFLLTRGYVESAREDFYTVYQQGYRPVDVLKVLADIEKEKGNFAKAIQLIEQALELDQSQDELWFRKAELEVKLAQIDEAKASCYKATQLAPQKIAYHKLYVEILIYLKQRKELEQHIEKVHQFFPEDAWVSLRMSSLLVERGELKRAVEILIKALKENPENQLLMFQIATILAGERNWEEAIKFFKMGLKQDPDSAWAKIQLGKVYLQNGEIKQAIDYLEQARQAETNDPFVYETLARIYNRKNDTFEAEQIILEGLAIDEDNQTLVLEYANLLEKRGKIKETTKAYEEGLENDPDNAFILGKLGNLYRLSRQYDKSLKVLQKAISINPKATWIRAYYVETLDDLERWDEALAEIDKLLEIMPNDYWAFAKRSLIQIEVEALEKAYESVSRAIELKPEADWLKEIEGRILERLQKYEQAEAAFQAALVESPDSVRLLKRLAYVQLHTDKKQALETIKKAIDYDDFDLGTIELYLYLTGKTEQYWAFSRDDDAYKVYKDIIFKRFSEAEKDLERMRSESDPIVPFLATFLMHMKREKTGNIDLETIPENQIDSAWKYYYLGVASLEENEFTKAKQAFKQGLKRSSDNPWIMIKLAYACQQLKQHTEAVELLNRFLRLQSNGEFMWVQLRLALNYDLAKKFVDSERVYKQILAKYPEDNVALNNLAWMYLNATEESMHKLDDALKLAQKAVRIRPSSANLDTLAEAYFQKGEYVKALKAIEQALDKDRRGLDDFKKTQKKILRAIEAQEDGP